MAGAVQAFIDRHWASVLTRMESLRAKIAERSEILDFVRSVQKEWEAIPLEEKQIPYVPSERNFWAALTALDLCAKGREGVQCPTGELPNDYESMLAAGMEVTYDCMRNRKPLPEAGFVGRRHLP
jgi:hypothetical protein